MNRSPLAGHAAGFCAVALLLAGAAVPADWLFEDRLDPASLDRAIAALSDAAVLSPADPGPRLKLAQAEAFWSDLHPDASPDDAGAHLQAGIQAAGEALALLSPRYGRRAEQGVGLLEALSDVEPSGAIALYWVAADQHRLAAVHGLAWLLLEEPELRRLFQRVVALDPGAWYGGALRHLAELDIALPIGFAPADLAVPARELAEAEKLGPEDLSTHVVWAERWAVKAQDYRTFLRELDAVDRAPCDRAPELWPENELARRKARALRAEADVLFTRPARAAVAAPAPSGASGPKPGQ